MRSRAPGPRRPLLVGHFGGHNAGDEAILDGTCRFLDAAGVDRVRVVARRSGYRPRLGAQCRVEVVAAAPLAVIRAIGNASVVVLCGGTHFYDDIPLRRRLRHYRYLSRYLLVLGWARARRRPVLALGQGIGPVVHPTGQLLTRALLRLVPAGTVRDDASLARARELGARAGWTRTADAAFGRTSVARPRGAAPRSLTLTPLYGARASGTGAGDLGSLWDALVTGVADAWPTMDLDCIEALAVRGGDRESDSALATALAARCRSVAPSRARSFTGDVDAMVDELGASAVVVCGRFHALVLALVAGTVPVVLPTHQKLLDLAELVELPEALVVREATPDAIAGALIAAAGLDGHALAPRLDALRDALARDCELVSRAHQGAGRRAS